MYKQAAKYIQSIIDTKPFIGIILGSGLGNFAEHIENPTIINYSEIPGFPQTTVAGHKGQFVVGKMYNKNIIAMQGRFHYYEGNDPYQIVLPVRVMKELGIEILIVTNASGGINKDFKPGDFMIIKDHINFSGINPLIGPNFDMLGPRFPDMTHVYDDRLTDIMMDTAYRLNINAYKGIYVMMSGPSYETPAEINMLRILGADAVGMSTVPEVIAAKHAGLKVVGVSCITNMAAGVLDQPLTHNEVIKTADKSEKSFINLISSFICNI